MTEWQPMDTAPKDGTWVLLSGGHIDYGWDGDTQPPAVVGQYTYYLNGSVYDEGWWQFAWFDGGYYGVYVDPTGWVSL